MSRLINALVRGELQAGLRAATKDVLKMTADLSGANSEATRRAANILAREMRRLVSVPFTGTPSAPGEPPRLRLGRLRKSIKSRVVDGVRRVGTGSYTARFMEFGVDAPARAALPSRTHRGKNGRNFRISAKKAFGGRHIAPRPWARPAFANVQSQMQDAIVQGMSEQLAATPELG